MRPLKIRSSDDFESLKTETIYKHDLLEFWFDVKQFLGKSIDQRRQFQGIVDKFFDQFSQRQIIIVGDKIHKQSCIHQATLTKRNNNLELQIVDEDINLVERLENFLSETKINLNEIVFDLRGLKQDCDAPVSQQDIVYIESVLDSALVRENKIQSITFRLGECSSDDYFYEQIENKLLQVMNNKSVQSKINLGLKFSKMDVRKLYKIRYSILNLAKEVRSFTLVSGYQKNCLNQIFFNNSEEIKTVEIQISNPQEYKIYIEIAREYEEEFNYYVKQINFIDKEIKIVNEFKSLSQEIFIANSNKIIEETFQAYIQEGFSDKILYLTINIPKEFSFPPQILEKFLASKIISVKINFPNQNSQIPPKINSILKLINKVCLFRQTKIAQAQIIQYLPFRREVRDGIIKEFHINSNQINQTFNQLYRNQNNETLDNEDVQDGMKDSQKKLQLVRLLLMNQQQQKKF